ncbi:ERG1 squalene epoxidase [Kalaharituber pfeilii]|nr:ERG1 squalene epoxidase [Kalaharituber pfeilii]
MSTAKDRTYEIAIVGAGIIGTALAHAFGNQGRNVLLLERDLSEPDRIVGELLQPGGVAALEKLGLRDCLENIDAIPCLGYEVIYHGRGVHIPYPETEQGKQRQGRSFHHGRFVQNLRAAAKAAKGVTVVEATVTELVKNEATGQILGVGCRRKGQDEIEYYFASLTVCADGYASNFRKHLVSKKTEVTSKFVALELVDADMPRKYHGHVVLSDNAPILLYQISTHITRALVDVRGKVPADQLRTHLQARTADLPPSLRPSFAKAILARERYPSMPNSFLAPTVNTVPGLLIVGDAMNMRHPLTGGGMTVAFNDAVLLRELLSPENVPDLEDLAEVASSLSDFHWRRKGADGGSSVINILSMALYQLFAADSPQLRVLQKGCFAYFKLGGKCVSEPCGLLAGIIKTPMVLFWHFYVVAFYSIAVMFGELKAQPWRWPGAAVETVRIFWTACVVILPYIFSEMGR